MRRVYKPRTNNVDADSQAADSTSEENVVFKHEKDGLSIHITIYNTNNNANEGSEAGLKQRAETGGQISGKKGENANQGGQIAGKCGQNANQDSLVEGSCCDCDEDCMPEEDCPCPYPCPCPCPCEAEG